jgi:hypothetical protein
MLIRKSKLGVALAFALASASVAFSPQAAAVNLADDGLGEVALFQYYTAREGWQTFIRLVNTSDDMVPVKVRFRRATDSEDVLDFVVALSPRDMWVGWTDRNVDGQGTPGVITFDTSCLSPTPVPGNPSGWVSTPGTTRKYVTFKTAGAEEGHIEVISLGRTGPLLNTIGTGLYADTLHRVQTQVAPNGTVSAIDAPECGIFGQAFTPGAGTLQSYLTTSLQFLEPNNVLKANGYLIKPSTGQGAGFDPVMLANFWNPIGFDDAIPALLPDLINILDDDFVYPDDIGSPLVAALYDDANPNLDFAWPRVSQVRVDNPLNVFRALEDFLERDASQQVFGPATIVDQWDRGIDAVSAVLTRRSVVNEWAARETSGAGVSFYETEWVVTFPTRYPRTENFYFPYVDDGVPVIAPFTEGVTPIHTALWNREERTPGCVSGIGQDVACAPNNELPHEVNVITFRGDSRGAGFPANRLNSQVVTNIPQIIMPVPHQPGEWLGWMEMTFSGPQANAGLGSDARGSQTYDELPPIQFTYNLGESVFLRDDGGVFQEYCLFEVLTTGTSAGACGAIDPQAICQPDGTQVGDAAPGGDGFAQITWRITDDTLAGVELIDDQLPLPNTLLLIGPYAQPFLANSGVDREVTEAETCDVEAVGDDPAVAGVNPVFTDVPGGAVTYRGMPVIGFALNVYNLGNAMVNYAAAVDHGYKRDVRIEGGICTAEADYIGQWPNSTVWTPLGCLELPSRD